uniref:Uncharacterized protein n=1 Tax=Arundo donax TaxID=35708 RepID=A0A0A9AB24_ARUDO
MGLKLRKVQNYNVTSTVSHILSTYDEKYSNKETRSEEGRLYLHKFQYHQSR